MLKSRRWRRIWFDSQLHDAGVTKTSFWLMSLNRTTLGFLVQVTISLLCESSTLLTLGVCVLGRFRLPSPTSGLELLQESLHDDDWIDTFDWSTTTARQQSTD
ncbi:hypothetical protein M758_2G224300 [Ceratodon purpureus]|nr:hypothetical protein M758_2G224300 [Ceratodon purpureus]